MKIDTKIEDDQWAKEHGFILQRDSCEDCKKRWERGDKTMLGETMFCSMGHAYEVNYLKRDIYWKEKKKSLLDAIDPQKMTTQDAEKLINDIEDRYY